MSPQFLVVAYYTPNTNYQTLSENLRQSLERFSLPYHLESVPDLGSWEKNTHYKAIFLRKCLSEKTQNLLYVDVDAVFKLYPTLIPNLECDIAYRTENFRWRSDEALSGTIFLRNNQRVKDFVDRWIQLNEQTPAQRHLPETWEQKNMQRAQREFKNLSYFNFPPEYTFVFDHTRRMYPTLNPVIEHYQESRNMERNKSRVGGIIRK